MSTSPFIHTINLENFQALVLENSFKQPVLVDFWAEWCQPCQALMPILAKLAEAYAGKFHLAKVDTEAQQQLAAHFQIKSLPTLKLFVDGQAVDERMGALPESEIRMLLKQHIASETDAIMTAARQANDEGQIETAQALINQALAKEPDNVDLKIEVAQMIAAQGDNQGAMQLLDSLDMDGKKQAGVIKLRAEIEMAERLKDLPPIDEIEQKLAADPNHLPSLINKSNYLIAQDDMEAAMQCLLRVMTLDRTFRDDAGRKGLLTLFDMLGNEQPIVQKYRRKMFALLH